MDLVLSLAEDLLLDFMWSDELLAEWEQVIVREGKRTPEAARSVSEAIRRFFVTTRIDPLTYRDRVGSVPGSDPADRVHTAACAFGGATVLLTRNERDFPWDFLADHLAQSAAGPVRIAEAPAPNQGAHFSRVATPAHPNSKSPIPHPKKIMSG